MSIHKRKLAHGPCMAYCIGCYEQPAFQLPGGRHTWSYTSQQHITVMYVSTYLPTYLPTQLPIGQPVNLAHLGLDIPSRELIGGGTCNTGTSAFFSSSLLFLLLAWTTAATTVTATSTHTSSIPPIPADIAVISVLGPSPITSTVELGVTTAVDEGVWPVNVEVGLVAVEYWEETVTATNSNQEHLSNH